MSQDLPDACSELGPVTLPGDPDGNDDSAVDTVPHGVVAPHPGIAGVGELGAAHVWPDPLGRVTVVRLGGPRSTRFSAPLTGFAEATPTESDADGTAQVRLREHGGSAAYRVRAEDLVDFLAAHIHLAPAGVAGPVVASLYPAPPGSSDPSESPARHPGDDGDDGNDGEDGDELHLRGLITGADLVGPLAGDFPGFVKALRRGELYVNVHTVAFPDGEIRGQLGADD